jgi:uncharacterized protein (TIGR03437 family)
MYRYRLVLAFLCVGIAGGQAPSYSAASVVSTAAYTPGPFAPNSMVTIFGSNLAPSAQGITNADIQNNMLPTNLNSTWVYIDGQPAPLFYVSPGQINFVLPGTVGPAAPVLRVVWNSWVGPAVTLPLAAAAPSLFLLPSAPAYIIASIAHSATDYTTITPDAPAHAGDTVVIWATGLGKVQHNPAPGELPNYTSWLADPTALQVTIGGVALDPARILYAGLTPLSAALYQINLVLPNTTPNDPEIRVFVGGQGSMAGLKLAVR